jgi:hypothetical protein
MKATKSSWYCVCRHARSSEVVVLLLTLAVSVCCTGDAPSADERPASFDARAK